MRIFIAGGTGVIGRRAIPFLRDGGHEVTAISRSEASDARLQELGARPVRASLFVFEELRRAIEDHDVAINLATSIPAASRAFMPGAWRKTGEIRRVGSANLMKAAAASGVQRLIQESFAPIYADQGDHWIDERAPVKTARYNRSVVDAESAAASFAGTWVVLRFAFFYGPDSDFTQQMIGMVRRGWAASLGSPQGFISSISHDDAAKAVIAALSVPAGIYNVVDDEPVTKREFNDSLADALGVRHPRFLPGWMSHLAGSLGKTLARSQRISNRKLRANSSWSPACPSVREGWRSVVPQK